MERSHVTLEHIVALCKRRGFIYPSSEIYGGLNGVYDTGPLGVAFKQNIRHAWESVLLKHANADVVMFEGSLLGTQAMWEASGHVANFHDPLVDCLTCKHRFRADDVNLDKPCPRCGNKSWTNVREFNLMFSTQLGAAAGSTSSAYLRPETAQSIFVNFKNIIATNRVKIPFGVAQIGKAFRNEITPKQFLFRMREFEQMELEWFCSPHDARMWFDFWVQQRLAWYALIGVSPERIRARAYQPEELSHYSSATSDIEYCFPFGWKELEGVAYRGNFDLTQHSQHSGKDLAYFNEATKESYVPHVVESSVGVDRLFLTLLFEAYDEEHTDAGVRVVLRLHPLLAPIKAAFFPLVKDQSEPMEKLYRTVRATGIPVQFDSAGSIGKRYRRHDEIGTPLCFTYDFESAHDGCVTVRHRDTMRQERISCHDVLSYIQKVIGSI